MTVIAYKDGVIAADSRQTVETEAGGIRMSTCQKLFLKRVVLDGIEQDVIIATAGEGFPGLLFVDWFGSGKEPPEAFVHGDADFTCLVVTKGGLFEYDKWCRGEKILDPFYAVGCGAKGAMTAMHMGASAKRACEVTCLVDPLCALPITTMRLKNAAPKTRRTPVPKVQPTNGKRPEDANGAATLAV